MRDGLRREFPEVVTLVRGLPHPRVARVSLFWSVIAAFGTGFFVSAVVTILFSFLLRSTTRETPLPAPFEIARIAGTGAALSVAWVAGGRRAVAGYVGIAVLERLLALPGQLRFCDRIGLGANPPSEACSIGGYVIALWPQMLGVALAFALVLWIRAGAGDRNPTLEAAGVFTVAQSLGLSILNPILGPASVDSPVWPLFLLLTAIAAGASAGFTILRRATRTWRTLGILALTIAAEFVLLSLPLFLSQLVQARNTNLIGPFDLLAYFSPVFAVAAGAIVLYIAAASRVSATESS